MTCIARLIPLVLAFAAVTSSAAEKLSLRPRWDVGKTYVQEYITDMSISLPALGGMQEQKTSISQTISIVVTNGKQAGQKEAKVTFVGIKANLSTMGVPMSYDSTDPAKSPPFLQQTFGAMMGKDFTIVFDAQDKLVSIQGVEGITGTPLGQVAAPNASQMADAFRKSLELGLPEQSVAEGETWKKEDKLEMPPLGAILLNMNGKYVGKNTKEGRSEAKVQLDGKLASAGPTNPTALVGVQDGSTVSGEVFFDIERRLVASSTLNTDMKVSISGKDANIRQTVVMKTVSVKETAK